MSEFDIVLNDIRLRVICEEYKEKLITELMTGHAFIQQTEGIPTYRLIMCDDFKPKQYNFYVKMVDKWYDNATCDVWIDNFSHTVYMSNIQASKPKWSNQLIQYFACNLFNRLLEEQGYIAFHSSCVDKNNHGVAFIAPRNFGKTNCMLNMMSNGYNSVTNDKLAIQFDGKNLNGYGVAQDVSIRINNSFIMQPQNKKYVQYAKQQNIRMVNGKILEENNIHLESVQLAKLNNVQQIPTTIIKSIIFPNYDSNITTAIAIKLNKDELNMLLETQRLPLVHNTTSFFNEVKTSNHPIYDEKTTLDQIREIPAYKIIQGENTTQDFVNKVKKLEKKGEI